MGAVFTLLLLPLIIVIVVLFFIIMITIAIIGISAGIIGAGGIAASRFVSSKQIKKLMFYMFVMLFLFGGNCIIGLIISFTQTFWLIWIGIIFGILVIASAIAGICSTAATVRRKALRILLYVLFSLGITGGSIAVAIMALLTRL